MFEFCADEVAAGGFDAVDGMTEGGMEVSLDKISFILHWCNCSLASPRTEVECSMMRTCPLYTTDSTHEQILSIPPYRRGIPHKPDA